MANTQLGLDRAFLAIQQRLRRIELPDTENLLAILLHFIQMTEPVASSRMIQICDRSLYTKHFRMVDIIPDIMETLYQQRLQQEQDERSIQSKTGTNAKITEGTQTYRLQVTGCLPGENPTAADVLLQMLEPARRAEAAHLSLPSIPLTPKSEIAPHYDCALPIHRSSAAPGFAASFWSAGSHTTFRIDNPLCPMRIQQSIGHTLWIAYQPTTFNLEWLLENAQATLLEGIQRLQGAPELRVLTGSQCLELAPGTIQATVTVEDALHVGGPFCDAEAIEPSSERLEAYTSLHEAAPRTNTPHWRQLLKDDLTRWGDFIQTASDSFSEAQSTKLSAMINAGPMLVANRPTVGSVVAKEGDVHSVSVHS